MPTVVSESGDKAIGWVQALQLIFGGGPAAAIASIFCVAFFGLLAWHMYALRASHAAHLESVIRSQASVERIRAMEASVHAIAADIVKHHSPRRKDPPA